MRVNGIEVVGGSVSGYATAVALPEHDLCFDIGAATPAAVACSRVAITHGHLDHLGAVAQHGYLRGMTRVEPPTYIVPPWLVHELHRLFAFWRGVQNGREAPYRVEVSSIVPDVSLGRSHSLRSFPTDHTLRSQGYTLMEHRRKVREEYRGLPGPEYKRLRQEGIDFQYDVHIPLFTFTGDTRAAVLDTMPPWALSARVLAIECTFLGCDQVDEAEAVRKGHVHIDQLAARADRLVDAGAVLLTHFSRRYGNADVEAAIARLPQPLRSKTTYLPAPEEP